MKISVFGFFAYLGAWLWTSTFILAGYFLGQQFPGLREKWEQQSDEVHLIIFLAVVAVVALLFSYLVVRWLAARRKQAKNKTPAPPAR